MVRRSPASLHDVADLDNLMRAFGRAARGKTRRPDVQAFAARLLPELHELRAELLEGSVALGRVHRFSIRDPKPRLISAPAFRERVVHHALMAVMGPILDRSLVDDSFACRPGKGSHAAVRRAQAHARRSPFFVKVDVRRYFDSILHATLLVQLERRFKDPGVLDLCARILAAHRGTEGRGLPIGALTSQHFANLYLSPADRFLLEDARVPGMVRYMDDVVWWCRSAAEGRATLEAYRARVAGLGLELHPHAYVQRTSAGLAFLGVRVFADHLRLSRRRRVRFRRARARWEAAYAAGLIGPRELQAGGASALAIVEHAGARPWLRAELARQPPVEA